MRTNPWIRMAAAVALAAAAEERDHLAAGFAAPPAGFDTAPFWVWNDEVSPAQVEAGLRELAAAGMRSVIVHPRPGLTVPYLGERWFEMWRRAIESARELGMELWIYDENSYPSGFAGGWVPEAMPDAKAVNLVAAESTNPPAVGEATVAVFRIDGDEVRDVTAALRSGGAPGGGRYLAVARKTEGRAAEWYGGWWYVDLLRPGVTERFLEVTLEPYRQRFGDEFGRLIRGVFTDEPHISGTGGLPWTDDFAEQFERRRGYALPPHLASLFAEVGDWRRVRHDFYRTAHELFVERWAMPYHEYCRRHRLELTGHYWEHGWPMARQVPDNMAMYLWMQRPGIDILFNQYAERPNAQFGNVRSVREVHSAALQAGRPRNLCEAYGGSGWDVRFEDLRRIGDWLLALGINTINQHLSHLSIRGARKRDYPVSFSEHAPWWPLYPLQARYFARLQYALTRGDAPPAAALVLEPTTTCWMYQDGPKAGPRAVEIAEAFTDLLGRLEAAQVEYELGSEDILERIGAVEDGRLRVGCRVYHTVVLPAGAENLFRSTLRRLQAFAEAGGRIFALGPPPRCIDGRESDEAAALAATPAWTQTDPDALLAALAARLAPGARIHRADGDAGKLFHLRRVLPDGEFLFLANASSNEWSRGRVTSPARSAEDWDAFTGGTAPAYFVPTADGIEAPFELPPSSSRLLRFSTASAPPAPAGAVRRAVPVPPAGPFAVRRMDPAMLTLDFVDVECAGERRTNLHVAAAGDWVWSRHGFEKNPWQHAVQFRDQIVRRTFPPDSGFTLVYRFVIEGDPPSALEAVVERPDLYSIQCNGREVRAREGEWWLDRSFGRVPLGGAVRSGTNELTLTARPMTVWHEPDHVTLLGAFSARPSERGYILAAETPLGIGPWPAQGHPHYAGRMSYAAEFDAPRAGRHRVRLPAWHGAVAEVRVDRRAVGVIAGPPYELELARPLSVGRHRVEVVVYGLLKNLLGPFHAGPVRGLASPFHMMQAPKTGQPPGSEYDVIPCGLFEPFVVERLEEDAPAGGAGQP